MTGLKGDASTKYLSTGVNEGSLSRNDSSISVYLTTDRDVTTTSSYIGGTIGVFAIVDNATGFRSRHMSSSLKTNGTSTAVGGIIGISRDNSSDYDWRDVDANGTNIDPSTTQGNSDVEVFASNGGGFLCSARLATYHAGPALNLATLEGLQETLLNEVAAAGLILDVYNDAAAAYSLRNLKNSWTTSDVVEVRRSSDNATSGFTATEVSDGTMLAWVGTGGTDNGFVTTWYDQSGNAENVVQATTTKQPKIVSAGVAVVDNGKPSIDTRTTCFLTNNTIVGSQYDTTFAVGRTLGTANAFMHDGDSVNNMSVVQFSTEYFRLWNGAATITASDYPLGNQYLVYTKANNAGTDDEIAINGNSPLVDAGGSNTRSGLFIGSAGTTVSTSPWNGYISEFILYKSDQSANRISIETNINNHFSIYTPAYSVEAQDYFNRLSAAGDSTYTPYKQPLANYIDSLVALGGAYWDDMLSATSFVGVGIQGITVPLRDGMTVPTTEQLCCG